MVDAGDLKSPGALPHEGSIPSPGTLLCPANTQDFAEQAVLLWKSKTLRSLVTKTK